MTMKMKWLSTKKSLPQKTEFPYYFEGSCNEQIKLLHVYIVGASFPFIIFYWFVSK